MKCQCLCLIWRGGMEIDIMTPEEEQRIKDLGRWDVLEELNKAVGGSRIDIIGQNGNDGEHYGQVDTENFDIPNKLQVGGDHYKKFKIQPWDIIDAYDLDFYEGNVIKYMLREKDNRLEDLKKARHYLDKIIKDFKHG